MSYQTKHTSGPWSVSTGSTAGKWIEPSIAHVYGPYGTDEEGAPSDEAQNEANAHLIAAAPDLLSALMKAVESVNNNNVNRKYTDYVIPEWYIEAKAAIEKALNFKTSQP